MSIFIFSMVPRKGTQKFHSCPKMHIIWVYVPAGGPPKFQRRSCAGNLRVPEDLRTSQMRSPPLYFTSFCTVPNYCVPSPLLTCCAVPYWYQCVCHDIYQNMFSYNVIGQEVGKVSFRLYGKNIVGWIPTASTSQKTSVGLLCELLTIFGHAQIYFQVGLKPKPFTTTN